MTHSKLHSKQSSCLRLSGTIVYYMIMYGLSLIFNIQVFFFLCNPDAFPTLCFVVLMYYTHTHEDEENQLAIFLQKCILFHRLWNNLSGMYAYQEQLPSSAIYFIYYIVFLLLNTYYTNFSQPFLLKYNSIAWLIITELYF